MQFGKYEKWLSLEFEVNADEISVWYIFTTYHDNKCFSWWSVRIFTMALPFTISIDIEIWSVHYFLICWLLIIPYCRVDAWNDSKGHAANLGAQNDMVFWRWLLAVRPWNGHIAFLGHKGRRAALRTLGPGGIPQRNRWWQQCFSSQNLWTGEEKSTSCQLNTVCTRCLRIQVITNQAEWDFLLLTSI